MKRGKEPEFHKVGFCVSSTGPGGARERKRQKKQYLVTFYISVKSLECVIFMICKFELKYTYTR